MKEGRLIDILGKIKVTVGQPDKTIRGDLLKGLSKEKNTDLMP